MKNEEWRPVEGYDGLYEVSDLGRVRSLPRIRSSGLPLRGKVLAPKSAGAGYSAVFLWNLGTERCWLIHRLVLAAFVGPCPDEMEACHNNGNPKDNRLSNLRWDTRASNAADRLRHGKGSGQKFSRAGVNNGMAKLSEENVREIRKLHKLGVAQRYLAQKFSIDRTVIQGIVRGHLWKSVA